MKTFGRIYGDLAHPSFITRRGVPVWMWRKRQKVRFLTAKGRQIGPEHSNVFPAMLSAFAAGWFDANLPYDWNVACQAEVKRNSRAVVR